MYQYCYSKKLVIPCNMTPEAVRYNYEHKLGHDDRET